MSEADLTMICPRCWGSKHEPPPAVSLCAYCHGIGIANDVQLSRHFRLSEVLRSETARLRVIPNDPTQDQLSNLTVTCLWADTVADQFGGLNVSSGLRSDALNRAVNGSLTGAHPAGLGLDTHPSRGTVEDVVEWCAGNTALQFDQVIREQVPNRDGTVAFWAHLSPKSPRGEVRRQVLMTFDGIHFEPFNRNDPRVRAGVPA